MSENFNSENQNIEPVLEQDEDIAAIVGGGKTEKKIVSEIFEWLDVLVAAMISVVLVFSLFFRIATIVGDSMLDTLHEGEKVVISNVGYKPQVGDIVVISRNQNNSVEGGSESDLPIIKRVIAVGGQEVNIKDGYVYINGEKLDEPYLADEVMTYAKPSQVEFPMEVPMGYVFVLGDNRPYSLDSRSLSIGENGLINDDYILGRAMFRIFPFETSGGLKNE